MEKARPALVYQAVNLINGKRYIGMTTMSLAKRAKGHRHPRNRGFNMPICAAIMKYGDDMIRFSILKKCASRDEAYSEERRLIALLKPEYNVSTGGRGGAGVRKTETQKQATSEWMIANGQKAWAASAAAHRKKVLCVSDGRVFPSCADAARHYGVCRAAITLALKGRNASAAGRVFAYYKDGDPVPTANENLISDIRAEQKRKMVAATPRKPVVCVNDGREYSSVTEAGLAYGLTIYQVSKVLGGQIKNYYGLTFQYARKAS